MRISANHKQLIAAFEAKLANIERVQTDDEVAHILEDDLHVEVLKAICEAHSAAEAKAFAEIALKTESLDFMRYCA